MATSNIPEEAENTDMDSDDVSVSMDSSESKLSYASDSEGTIIGEPDPVTRFDSTESESDLQPASSQSDCLDLNLIDSLQNDNSDTIVIDSQSTIDEEEEDGDNDELGINSFSIKSVTEKSPPLVVQKTFPTAERELSSDDSDDSCLSVSLISSTSTLKCQKLQEKSVSSTSCKSGYYTEMKSSDDDLDLCDEGEAYHWTEFSQDESTESTPKSDPDVRKDETDVVVDHSGKLRNENLQKQEKTLNTYIKSGTISHDEFGNVTDGTGVASKRGPKSQFWPFSKNEKCDSTKFSKKCDSSDVSDKVSLKCKKHSSSHCDKHTKGISAISAEKTERENNPRHYELCETSRSSSSTVSCDSEIPSVSRKSVLSSSKAFRPSSSSISRGKCSSLESHGHFILPSSEQNLSTDCPDSVGVTGKLTKHYNWQSKAKASCALKRQGKPCLVPEKKKLKMDFSGQNLKTESDWLSSNSDMNLESSQLSVSDEIIISDDEDITLCCIPCECCLSAVTWEELAQCCEGHTICLKCIEKEAKSILSGDKSGPIICPKDLCNGSVPRSETKKVLHSMIFELLEEKCQKDDLSILENLRRCPWCEFAAELEPGEKMFLCRNKGCGRISCVYCKKEWPSADHTDCTETSRAMKEAANQDTLPAHWQPVPEGKDFLPVTIDRTSSEFSDVQNLFFSSMRRREIKAIYRIQNPKIWQKYSLTRRHIIEDFGQDNLNETRLFHGTSLDTIKAICQEGFDWRMCGRNGTVYGQGTYFAKQAKYSHGHASLSGRRHRIPTGSHGHGSLHIFPKMFQYFGFPATSGLPPFQPASTVGSPIVSAFGAKQTMASQAAGMFGSQQTNNTSMPPQNSFCSTMLNVSNASHISPFRSEQSSVFSSHQGNASSSQQASGFGSQQGSGVSSQQASGANSQQASGANSQQASGANSQQASGFGSLQSNGFGLQQASGFGCQQPGAFGSQQANAFGSQDTAAVGSHGASTFGSQQASAFGCQGTSAFGSQGTSAFGSQQPSVFSASPVATLPSFPSPASVPTSVHSNTTTIFRQHPNVAPFGNRSFQPINQDLPEHGKTHFLFLARVLVGRSCRGESKMRRPPPDPFDVKKRPFNSCVNNKINPDIFVIFDSSQAYPEYLIEYL